MRSFPSTQAARTANLEPRMAFLREMTLFRELTDTQLATLMDDLRLREYRRGETIFRQGDDGYELFFVLSGKIRIFKISPAGEETSLVILSTHDVIGEQAVIENVPRNATGKAIDNVSLLAMSHERFRQHMQSMPELSIGLARMLSQKLNWTAALAESIAQFDAAGRLLHLLLLYTRQHGEENADGHCSLELGLNQSDLASLVGARREWVNRLLRDWRKRGLLTYTRGVVTMPDIERVEAERDSRIEANQGEVAW